MRFKLIAAALIGGVISATYPSAGRAQGVDMGPSECYSCRETAPAPSYSPPEYQQPSPDEQARQQRREEAQAANHRGVGFHKNREWAKAVAAYQEAVDKDPDDQTMRNNLARAQAALTNEQGSAAYNNGDFAGAVALFQEAVDTHPVDTHPDDQTYMEVLRQNLAAARSALANAQAKLESEQRDKAAAGHMQEAVQSFARTLNAAPAAGGLDFDGGKSGDVPAVNSGLDFTTTVTATNKTEPAAAPSVDPNVVDGRVPSGLAKPVEDAISGAYRDAPPGVSDRVRKGFQAVATKDWKVAKAWFEDALSRDPNNAGLKRMIELTDHVPNAPANAPRAVPAKSPPPSQAEIDAFFKNFREGRRFASTEEVRSYVLSMPEDEFRRQSQPPSAPPTAGLQLPRPDDVELMFPDLQSKDGFIMSELISDMMGAQRPGE